MAPFDYQGAFLYVLFVYSGLLLFCVYSEYKE